MSCESLGLSLSVSKSAVTRVGPAFKHDCVKVRLGTVEVEYVDLIKYSVLSRHIFFGGGGNSPPQTSNSPPQELEARSVTM